MHENILHKIGDREYTCSPLTQEVQNNWRAYIESQELASLRANHDKLLDSEYTELLKDHLYCVKHKKYQFFSSVSLKYIQEDEHLSHFFLFVLGKHNLLTLDFVKDLMGKHPEDFSSLFELLVAQKKS